MENKGKKTIINMDQDANYNVNEPGDQSERPVNIQTPFRPEIIHHGMNILIFRLIAGLSQTDLAQKINKSQQFVSELEKKKKIEDDTLEEVAKALGVDAKYLKNWSTDGKGNTMIFEKQGDGQCATNMAGTYCFETNHKTIINNPDLDKICSLYDNTIFKLEDKIRQLEQLTEEIKEKNIELRIENLNLKSKVKS